MRTFTRITIVLFSTNLEEERVFADTLDWFDDEAAYVLSLTPLMLFALLEMVTLMVSN